MGRTILPALLSPFDQGLGACTSFWLSWLFGSGVPGEHLGVLGLVVEVNQKPLAFIRKALKTAKLSTNAADRLEGVGIAMLVIVVLRGFSTFGWTGPLSQVAMLRVGGRPEAGVKGGRMGI